MSSASNLSLLLSDVSTPEKFSQAVQAAYGELRRMAAQFFKRERQDHTWQPTALVHEVFLRLAGEGPDHYENRAHFFGVAARAMRQLLVDHARRCRSQKRGGGWQRVPADELELRAAETLDYLALDELLERLERLDERLCRIVELRVFAGLTSREVAEILVMGESTVRAEWAIARAWLEKEIRP